MEKDFSKNLYCHLHDAEQHKVNTNQDKTDAAERTFAWLLHMDNMCVCSVCLWMWQLLIQSTSHLLCSV